MEKDQEFVEFVVKSIVDNPDKVKVTRTVDEMGVLITLAVAPDDMGKVIGKEGRTAKSIRTLLRVLGAKNNARVNLKIEEPEGGRAEPLDIARDRRAPERRGESRNLDEPEEKGDKEEKKGSKKVEDEQPIEESKDEEEKVTELI